MDDPSELKILFWDLETTELNADWGRLICMGYKWAHEDEVHLLRDVDFKGRNKYGMYNDKKLAKAARDVLAQADVWVTWFGTYFDIPFMNTRLLFHGLKPLPQPPLIKHIDGWKTARKQLRLKSNRLDHVARLVGTIDEKTKVDPFVWQKASHGHRPSLSYIYDHCIKDIKVLEEVYYELRPLIKGLPSVALATADPKACPRCGAHKLQKRGWGYNSVSRYRRFQCTKCGGWCRGRNERVSDIEARV